MSIVFKTETAFTDNTLPFLKIDDIMPDTMGALALFDASLTEDVSFIGVNAGTIQNLAWLQAKTLIPAATEETLKGVTAKLFTSGDASGIVNLSGKKGINVINSKVSSAANNGFAIHLPLAIKEYILANPGHKYFMSLWGRFTRVQSAPSNQYAAAAISGSNINTTRLMVIGGTGIVPPSTDTTYFLGQRNGGASFTAIGTFLKNVASNGTLGTMPAANSPDFQALVQFGSKDPYRAFNVNNAASGIIYKWYLEDLTASGRTYAQVDAIDLALYNEAFAAGGRFADDTFTAPSTIA